MIKQLSFRERYSSSKNDRTADFATKHANAVRETNQVLENVNRQVQIKERNSQMLASTKLLTA